MFFRKETIKETISENDLIQLINRIEAIARIYKEKRRPKGFFRGTNIDALNNLKNIFPAFKEEHKASSFSPLSPSASYIAIIKYMEKQYLAKENEKVLKDLLCCNGKSLAHKMNEKPNDYHYHRLLALTLHEVYTQFPETFSQSKSGIEDLDQVNGDQYKMNPLDAPLVGYSNLPQL